MRALARVLACALLFCIGAGDALAQFKDQMTYVATSSGTNAIAVTVQNASSYADLLGVPIRVLVTNGNSGPVTFNVNSFGTSPAVQKPTTAGLAALVTGDIVAGQIYEFIYDGTVFELHSPTLFSGTVPAFNGFVSPVNLSLSCTAAANALTCAMLSAQTGLAPTALSPIYVPFRNATIANGAVVWRTMTSAASFTISGGSTMGCVSGAPCRLWLLATDNAGAVQVCAFNALSGVNVAAINEGILWSSGSGTGGGSSAQTLYCNAASLSGVAVRIIGYVEYTTLTTAGTWTTPNFVQLFGPGIKKPGDILQVVYGTSSAASSNSTNSYGTGAPQANAPAATITMSSAANVVSVEATGVLYLANGDTDVAFASIFRGPSGSVNTAIGVVAGFFTENAAAAAYEMGQRLEAIDAPATTTPQIYTVRVKNSNGAAIVRFGDTKFGTPSSSIKLMEIQGANDNERFGLPSVMAG